MFYEQKIQDRNSVKGRLRGKKERSIQDGFKKEGKQLFLLL